jgi:hypothetical protein
MSNVQLDVNKIVESLVNQISQQAQRIAVLEATIDAIQKGQESAEERPNTTEK